MKSKLKLRDIGGSHEPQKSTIEAVEAPSESPMIDPSIPPYYHWHWKVFDETASYRFPPARRDDHPINLKPGAPDTLDCKIYRLMEVELQTTQEFIRDELAKGYIEESNSPYTSPLFYRAKKDGKLCLLRFHWTSGHYHFFLSYPLHLDPHSFIICRSHRTASFISLIPYHPYRQSSLGLSSGWSLIALSLWLFLSCTMYQPTKQCYYTLGLCPFTSVALPAQSRLRVYKLYYHPTWTLSLSFCTIETSEPESKELHKLVDFPVSLLSAAA